MVPVPKNTENGIKIGDVEIIWAINSKEFFFSNSLLINDPILTVVDPSANFSYLEYLASRKDVKQVLNTHFHVDHRSLNSLFHHAKFMCHKLDEQPLVSFDNYLEQVDPFRQPGYVKWLKAIFASLDIGNAYFGPLFRGGERLPLKDQEVQVIHLPGHTAGHIGLLFKDASLFFVSDVDLTPAGPWYANLHSSIDDFLNSITRIKEILCRYYVTSHGVRLYDSEQFFEKLHRFESFFQRRDQKVLETLNDYPQDLNSLSKVGIIYKRSHLEKDPLKAAFERGMITKHLERLERLGEIEQDGGIWRIRH